MEFKIKKFAFKDMQKIAETFTLLDLNKEQLKEITSAFNQGSNKAVVDVSTKTKVENYLKDNFGEEEVKTIKKTMNTQTKLKAYIQTHATQSAGGLNENLINVVAKLITIVGAKFDVIVDFMAYFIEDVTKADIYELDGDESADALKAVFTNKEMFDFFSRMFN